MEVKIQHIVIFVFMALGLVAKGYAEDFPAWTKVLVDTATIATGLAALCMRPPWDS